MSVWQFYAGIPFGAVYSNLIASVICWLFAGALGLLAARAQLRRHRERVAAENAEHRKQVADMLTVHHEATRELVRSVHARLDDLAGSAGT